MGRSTGTVAVAVVLLVVVGCDGGDGDTTAERITPLLAPPFGQVLVVSSAEDVAGAKAVEVYGRYDRMQGSVEAGLALDQARARKDGDRSRCQPHSGDRRHREHHRDRPAGGARASGAARRGGVAVEHDTDRHARRLRRHHRAAARASGRHPGADRHPGVPLHPRVHPRP